MQSPDYSIGVVTYLGRYETYFQPFLRELAEIFPEKEIIVFVNGHYDIVLQTAYLKEVTAFLSTFRNVRYVTHLEHQSLARGWNHLVWLSRYPRVLICNDDLRIKPSFREHMERGLAEYPDFFVINKSWSHFIMSKDVIRQVGWFDERFKGVGYEDGDYMVRMIAANRPLVSVPCEGINNIVANQANAGWANQSRVTRGKYSLMNEEFFRQKYESNFTAREDRMDDVYAVRFPWNGEILKATLREGMAAPEFYPFAILNDSPLGQVSVVPSTTTSASVSNPQPAAARKAKIVGLVPSRNEAPRLPFCLRALARYTDAIVFLDDCSEDDSLKVVKSLAAECRVERILCKSDWHLDEPGDRNRLLDAGREIGGTHFISVDADEAFTANCSDHDYLSRLIRTLQPGDQIAVNWIQLWRDVGQFRLDDSVWTWNYKGVIFCDDGRCRHSSDFVHTPRVPSNLSGQTYRLSGYTYGLMHFQFVNWRNLLVKQAWYRCLERVRDPQKPAASINERYAPSKDERSIRLRVAPSEWLAGYPFFDAAAVNASEWWREKLVRQWFMKHRQTHFKDLDIWDIDWSVTPAKIKRSNAVPVATQEDLSVRAVPFIEQAEQYQTRGDFRGAHAILTKALDWAPDEIDLLLAASVAALHSGEAHTARWLAIRATLQKPDYPMAFLRLAEAALSLGKTTEVNSALKRATQLAHSDPIILLAIGNVLMGVHDFKSAANYFQTAYAQTPTDTSILLRLGLCFFSGGDAEGARDVYTKILKLDPDNKTAQENLKFLVQAQNPPIMEPGLV